MKKSITTFLALTTGLLSLAGCSFESSGMPSGSTEVVQENFGSEGVIHYNDDEIQLQPMGTYREGKTDNFDIAVNLGLLPKDTIRTDKVTGKDFKNILKKNFCGKGQLIIKDSEVDSLKIPDNDYVKIGTFVSLMSDILATYTTVERKDLLPINTFKELFEDKHNDFSGLSEDFINRLILLRAEDALIINYDDVFIFDNTLTYNVLGEGLLRLLDLRIAQIVNDYYPDECQQCGVPIQTFYELYDKVKDEEAVKRDVELSQPQF